MMNKMMLLLVIISLSLVWAVPVPKSRTSRYPTMNPALFEGDMVGFNPHALQGALIAQSKWIGGIVPYQIDAVLTDEEKGIFQAALDGYANKTCIKFKKRTCQKDYISIQKLDGCYSNVGRTGGMQTLSLGDGCWYTLTVQHEFMHALGFVHEQSRPDRDDYVKIDFTNIEPANAYNFDKYAVAEIDTAGTPYDYGSIMHYPPYAFAVDTSKPTIIVPAGKTITQPDFMSDTDALEINKYYKCTAFLG